ncbi:hypothetical protein [Halomontanus rarus]|uniref:hypothetical protein n=1 Tax=Halomontanus rarus TaxID=3034020 RepID=UPI001A99E9FA
MTLPRHRDDERSDRPKSTLFCTACDHESPVGGDWRVRTRGDRTVTVCPDCGTTIDERPASPPRDDATIRHHPGVWAIAASARVLLTSAKLWCAPLVVTSRAFVATLDRP